MKSKLRLVAAAAVLLAIGYAVGRYLAPEPAAREPSAAVSAGPTEWTCSMHPQIRMPEPGKCPICFMDLIPVDTGAGNDLGPRVLEMSPAAAALADIETAPVERRLVAREVPMVGKVAYDETRLSYITAWVRGRLDRLFVDYTGVTVREGDHLVEIYSPKLFTAQQELLQAIATAQRLESSPMDVLKDASDRTVSAAREKLRLYGLSPEQIEEVVERGEASELVTINSPAGGIVVHKNALKGMYVDEGTQIYTIADLSKIWVLLDAYESDLAWLRYGLDVEFQVEAYPGETFHGRVAFIDPVLDDRTRTVSVRLNVENPDLRLKPDMFVSATAKATLTPHGRVVDEALEGKWMCPMHPEVLMDEPDACTECGMDLVPTAELGFTAGGDTEPPLVIPVTAPLVTGKRAVVYVAVADREQPTFEGRDVVLGPRAGDWYIVHEGLAEGEEVVVRGNFKIDSELQLRAQPSMMNPDERAARGPALETPASFRGQLGDVADAYLSLQLALSEDDDERAAAAAREIADMLRAIDMGALDGEAHAAWMEAAPPLARAAGAAARTDDIEPRRIAFGELSVQLIDVLERFGHERDGPGLSVFHCPMALDGEGGDWIQTGEETANPYYGASMYRCGSLDRSIEGRP
jgi:Cu(I)/Ag(I) efflux system membrane fusion protein